jgi:hypothetical protein
VAPIENLEGDFFRGVATEGHPYNDSKKEENMFRVPLALAILVSIAIGINAQSQANTGNIEGRVTDPNAASVPNVTVTATNLANGLQKSAQTNDEGIYRIVFLTPGAYKVETSGAQGFVPATFTNVIVTVGGQTPLDIQLAVGNATVAMVDVSAEGQVVETTRTSVSSVVNERAIQNLPVNGRNFLDFATLTPSVVRDPTRQGDLAVGARRAR